MLRTKYKGIAKDLVSRLKFERAKAASSIIADSMLELVIDKKSDNQEQILVPLPTASSRRRQRGYDHSQLIARRLSSSLGVPYRPALTRLGQARQVGSIKIDRLSQMEDAFRIKFGASVKDKDVLLVDDVLTTGASLEAAASCLLNSGAARVDALVFARA
jgi:ComF family protein